MEGVIVLSLRKTNTPITWALLCPVSFQGALVIKNLPANAGNIMRHRFRSLDWEDVLEEGMTAHSSILAWRIPWTEERGGLQSLGSHRVGHD